MHETTLLHLRLSAVRYESESILAFEFRDPAGGQLPPFEAGAHVDVHLPSGLVRSYSLCNDSSERDRYVVAVARDARSRGGSVAMHDALRVGQLLPVAPPRNHFPLDATARKTVLIAGGVGITPMWCMVQQLQAAGRDWSLHYATRSRRHAAFLREIEALDRRTPERIRLHFDDEHDGPLDIAQLVRRQPTHAHLYCCGPLPMLQAFEEAASGLPREQVHVEYFQAKQEAAKADGLELVLRRSAKTISVGPGQSVLDAVLDAGVDVPYSCMDGICGSCEVSVLEGEPEHRDSVLSEAQRQSNRTMMICCSGARSARLVLDI